MPSKPEGSPRGEWVAGCPGWGHGHSTKPSVPSRLLWYPGNNHALAGVEAEADGFMNMVLWLLKHLQC